MAQENGDGQKLAFGFKASKTKVKVAVNVEEPKERRQLIVGIEGSKIRAVEGHEDDGANGGSKREPKIIAPIANTFKTGVGKAGFIPSFVPPANDAPVAGDTSDRFELATDSRPVITEYGLEVRARPGEEPAKVHEPIKLQTKDLELQAYKRDMELLPDMAPVEAYESMPIEDFGRAMLMGMGWKEGMGVGRNRKVAEPIEYLRRPDRLGLGAKPVPVVPEDPNKKKIVKMGDKPTVRPEDLVLAPDADGRQRHIRKLDEKLVHRSELEPGPRPGKVMAVVGGRHAGLRCTVLSLLPVEEERSERATVRLEPSGECVDIRCKDLEELGKPAQQPVPASNGRDSSRRADDRQQQRSSRDRDYDDGDGRGGKSSSRHRVGDGDGGRDKDRGEDRDRGERGSDGRGGGGGSKRDRGDYEGRDREQDIRAGRGKDRDGRYDRDDKYAPQPKGTAGRGRSQESDEEEDSEGGAAPSGPPPRSWLAPFIKVRIVDKHLEGGKLYLKKGTVVDVHPGATCDVAVDDSRLVVQVRQSGLETVIPKEVGAPVLVVSGTLRGHKARLHARSEGGAAAIQLASDFSVHRLLLDNVAAYVGSMDDEL